MEYVYLSSYCAECRRNPSARGILEEQNANVRRKKIKNKNQNKDLYLLRK